MRSINQPLKMISFLLISITLSVGLLGVSYSYFTGVNQFDTKATMGDIDVVISKLDVVSVNTNDPTCTTEASIVNRGKCIDINIKNACVGYTSTINYEITNKGTTPVVYKLKQPFNCSDNPVQMDVNQNIEYIKGEGGQAWGQITVTVGETTGDVDNYCLSTELDFQQAIVEIK